MLGALGRRRAVVFANFISGVLEFVDLTAFCARLAPQAKEGLPIRTLRADGSDGPYSMLGAPGRRRAVVFATLICARWNV